MNDDQRRVSHMLHCAQAIQTFLKGRRRSLAKDELLQSALLRKFEVMGAAATQVSTGFREAHPEIPWKRIIAFGSLVMHGYDRNLLEGLQKAVAEVGDVEANLKTLVAKV